MKQRVACLCVLTLGVACSASNPPIEPRPMNSAGAAGSAGSAGAQANGGSGGNTTGGTGTSAGTGGVATGAAGTGGSGGSTAGAAGTGAGGASGAGGSGGGMATGFKCPAGPFEAPALTNAKATKVPNAPPSDTFNMNNFTNVEGPVWIGDSLYFSEMTGSNMIPPARILKLAPGGAVTVAVMDSGSNGLAVDSAGILTAAVHKDGSISQIALPAGAVTPIISMYMAKRFTSPNDLALRSDGTIYFSDPQFQNQANPQGAERLYWVTPAPTRTVTAITQQMGAPSSPNGVTLSPDEKTLYVSGSGLKKFTVGTDGSLSGGTDFIVGGGGDGMAVDCAGNLYVAGNMGNVVRVYSPTAALLGTIQANNGGTTTNVAFGGADHKTLYITAQGNEGQRGVFSIALNVPGFPY